VLLSVQVLRAVAALLVLASHVGHDLTRRLGFEGYPPLQFGAGGVDVFFVISGFIMVWSSRGLFGQPGAAGTFMARRLVRIVPLDWATTLLFLAGILIHPPMAHRGVDPPHLVASLLFLPWPDQDGEHSPFYGIGWTLNYEMFFYVAFALLLPLAARPRAAVLALSLAFAALAVAGLLLRPAHLVPPARPRIRRRRLDRAGAARGHEPAARGAHRPGRARRRAAGRH
jgi:exopolysaccharide production protein ExoZ